MLRPPHAVFAGAILVLGLFACANTGSGTGDDATDCIEVESSGEKAAFMADRDVPAELQEAPDIKMDGCGDPPDELVTEDLLEGEGTTVEKSSSVTVNYTGVLWPAGEEFDSSWSRSEPAAFTLSGVIPGWSEGLVGMKEGGRRLLVIPPDLAYGSQGAGGDIPPDSTLVFVVDMLEVEGPVEVPEALSGKPVVTVDPGTTPPTTLEVQDEIVGTGPEAHAGDTITVNYVGVAWSTGQEFDSSWSSGQPATFVLGQLVPGFNQGVEGMKVGGRRRIVIPPDLAYGAQGRPPAIPPNETLVFVVDLLDIEAAGGTTTTTTQG